MQRLSFAFVRMICNSLIRPPLTPLQRLGIEIVDPAPCFRELPWSGFAPTPFVQVLSPGRAGTRWLADVLLASTRHAVIHSQVGSLGEIGYLLNHGRINDAEAFGAYLHARARALEFCHSSGCGLVDLDCKISPMVPGLMRRFAEMRCVVVLRDPLAFVKSGMARGYFRSLHPQLLGHLSDPSRGEFAISGSDLDDQSQARMIAWFWNRVAVLAQAVHEENPQRVSLLDMNAMFGSRSTFGARMSSLGLSVNMHRLASYRGFDQVKNANVKSFHTSFNVTEIASEIYRIAYTGLSCDFIAQCGLTNS